MATRASAMPDSIGSLGKSPPGSPLIGLARIGAALVAVNTRFRAAELEHVLRRSGARMLVLEPEFKKIDFPAILADVDAAAAQSVEKVAIVRSGSTIAPKVLGKPTVAFDA